MVVGGNRETSSAHIVALVNKWVEVKANPVPTMATDRKGVLRGSGENSSCLIKLGIIGGSNRFRNIGNNILWG